MIVALTTAIAAVIGLPSCGTFDGDSVLIPGINLPVEIGVQYQLEEDLWIQIIPADKGGIEVRMVGEGQLSKHIKKIDGGFEIESPATGLIYRITEGASGKPLITIIGGTGKIQPIPPAETQPTDPR